MQKQRWKGRTLLDVELVDHMGDDLTVVNAARVSFGKKKEVFDFGDTRLIKFLAKHDHWSPFGHCSMQFHIKAPIFVARQLVKHQVGLVWNEISRRYVDDEPEFYIPKEWRLRADDKKQGSSEETIEYNIDGSIQFVTQTYNNLLKANVAPEMARMVLPQNLYTEWYWSGTLMAFARVCNLRCAKDTQYETQIIANKIDNYGHKLFPASCLNSEILIKGQMRFDNAFCFGNGKSRLDFDMDVIKDKGTTFGCNAIYRDMVVDHLVTVDNEITHEIYRSGYCMDNQTHIRDWNVLPMYFLDTMKEDYQDADICIGHDDVGL